ncbi:hypothetical protein RHMOL_Rhmol03G0109600 [Rhododendron molle]|uniref:Uncharacterized protein n=1 Tax=Rhododendron molle TaxID=49168 RepID=A0ACC0PF70_RHOML|nr:hypothetical protein RHMOL_Rhmol03G0109600 [Rhododendron molle]
MQRMGSKEIILFLMVCFHFYYPASCLPLGKNLTSGRKNKKSSRRKKESYELCMSNCVTKLTDKINGTVEKTSL